MKTNIQSQEVQVRLKVKKVSELVISNSVTLNGFDMSKFETLRELNRTIKRLKKEADILANEFKVRLGDKEVLIDTNGNEIATYNHAGEVDKLDAKGLKANFHDVWQACVTRVAGSRRFLIKV